MHHSMWVFWPVVVKFPLLWNAKHLSQTVHPSPFLYQPCAKCWRRLNVCFLCLMKTLPCDKEAAARPAGLALSGGAQGTHGTLHVSLCVCQQYWSARSTHGGIKNVHTWWRQAKCDCQARLGQAVQPFQASRVSQARPASCLGRKHNNPAGPGPAPGLASVTAQAATQLPAVVLEGGWQTGPHHYPIYVNISCEVQKAYSFIKISSYLNPALIRPRPAHALFV